MSQSLDWPEGAARATLLSLEGWMEGGKIPHMPTGYPSASESRYGHCRYIEFIYHRLPHNAVKYTII